MSLPPQTLPTGSPKEQLDERDLIIARQQQEIDRLRNGVKEIAYSGRTKGAMKQTALRLIGLIPS